MAETAGVDVEDVREGGTRVAPDVREQVGAGDDAPRVARHVDDERELGGRERNVAYTPPCRMAQGVDHEVAHHEPRRWVVAAPPREGAESREELAEVERFGEVVVGTGIEARDALIHAVERGEHQNGQLIPALP